MFFYKRRLKKIQKSIEDLKISNLRLEYLIKNGMLENRICSKDFIKLNSEPILTICMPVYNGERFLRRAIESILMQDCPYNYKIWAIDDCSSDQSVKILKRYEEMYPDIFVISVNKKNEKGMTMAPRIYNGVKTKYWMNFDQDDYFISPNKLDRFITYFENHPECTLVSSNLLVKKSNVLNPAYNGTEDQFTFQFTDYPHPLGILLGTTATMFRNCFNETILKKINSYVGTEKGHCVVGDTFRNVLALSFGYGYYESSIDSVYSWTGTGVWSKLNCGQQDFYNLQFFYDSIDFFDSIELQNKMIDTCNYLLPLVQRNVKMLSDKELFLFEKMNSELTNRISIKG